MTIVHYLAYGSNLHPFRLAARVPSAQALGIVPMPGRRLAFHKRSRDGSGKCLFYNPGGADDIMYGVVYEFDSAEKTKLDALEGKGKGYYEQFFSVPLNGTTYNPYVYVAATTHIDASLVPYDWYKEMVLLGARYHQLPADYIARVEAISSFRDPDRQNARKNEEILCNMRRMNAARGC